ncbi:hypothetical protein RCL49_25260, partial [Salmonella enterica subsp. enterica serovar Typhimurium]
AGGKVLVGKKNHFYLQCKDRYGNLIDDDIKKAAFSVDVWGQNLVPVGRDRIYPTITGPDSTGLYKVEFTVAWVGDYVFRVQLMN